MGKDGFLSFDKVVFGFFGIRGGHECFGGLPEVFAEFAPLVLFVGDASCRGILRSQTQTQSERQDENVSFHRFFR